MEDVLDRVSRETLRNRGSVRFLLRLQSECPTAPQVAPQVCFTAILVGLELDGSLVQPLFSKRGEVEVQQILKGWKNEDETR